MKIETKLNIDDKVFFLHENKVISSIVQGIRIEVYETGDKQIIYVCNQGKDQNVNLKIVEKFAFKNKEELIRSL